jgi:hypothetical protein
VCVGVIVEVSSTVDVACRAENDTGDIFDDTDEKPEPKQVSPPPDPLADSSYPKSSPHAQVWAIGTSSNFRPTGQTDVVQMLRAVPVMTRKCSALSTRK